MKKIALVLFCTILASCSKSDDSQTPKIPFFNLKIGNSWSYKEYYQGDQFIRNIEIEVVRDTIIGGLKYAMLSNDEGNNGFYYTFRRVDVFGHLVNESGRVIHPGYDMNYRTTQSYNGGILTYHMMFPKLISVEQKNYYVYPFDLDYTPVSSDYDPAKISSQYQPGLGMVYRHQTGNPEFEYRLVSAHLN